MLLYHLTDQAGRDGIEARGFGLSHVGDSPHANWFSASQATPQIASRRGWWVIVDIPDEIAESCRYYFDNGEPYEDHYLVPWDVVNRYVPFAYQPAPGVD